MNETLYLKIDKNILIRFFPVHIRDIASVSCSTKSVEARVKSLILPTEIIQGAGRYVFSVFDVMEVIQKEYPTLQISNMGETDFILTIEKTKTLSPVFDWIKTVLVALLSFFGAAFSIMAFNNDIDVTKLFSQLYETFTGQASDGFTVLEVSYSVGVGLGILIFFHHFARKNRSADPTPLEVEMRTYEDEVDTTLMESETRKNRHRTD